MILDKENLLSDDQAVTATADSTNVIDLGLGDNGPGTVLEIFAQVTTAFTAAGAATMVLTLTTDSVAAMSSEVTLYTSAAIAVADLVAGYTFKIRGLPDGAEQFIQMQYTVATGPMTAGNITSGVVFTRQAG